MEAESPEENQELRESEKDTSLDEEPPDKNKDDTKEAPEEKGVEEEIGAKKNEGGTQEEVELRRPR